MLKKFFLPTFSAFTLGALSAFSMAPWHLIPLLFAGLSGLYILIHRAQSARAAGVYGFLFGLGYFGFGLSWIGNALLVEGNPYKWVWPLAVAGLPLILSPFPALACGLFKKLCVTNRFRGYLAFTGFIALFEWLRGHMFTGFPWNLYGYAWTDILPLVQIVSIGTVYLLTTLTIFWAGLPGFLFVSSHKKAASVIIAASAAVLFGSIYFWGEHRLQTHPTEYMENTYALIVQPDIKQSDKWKSEKMGDNYLRQIALSRNDGTDRPEDTTYIVWPETAIAPMFLSTPEILRRISDMLAEYSGKAYLISGTMRREESKDNYRNSVVMIDSDANITNIYDKSHLVPFGEYIPLENLIDIAPIVGFSGFQKGNGPQTMTTPEGLRYSPLICYEIIFPGAVTETNSPPPDIIVNVTNDAWYGISAGPYQHFEQTLFRAIEEGVPVIRSANTGFSALIDPAGRTLYKSKLFEENAKKVAIPKRFAIFEKNIYRVKIIFFILYMALIFPGSRHLAWIIN